ncbi:MurR/RpiR family transcriptional regulator [Actinoplanes sp. G11-F43]|uniref:MurR/RpiR family transcriptional regulator n=1 Tax=Actinoplanes sp. G11-F43 TaxID=3424130 RepID=UPI003D32D331
MLEQGSLRHRIDAHRPRLSPGDLRVVDVLLSHPAEAAVLPAEQVATRAGVHVAAATRLAQKLGYTGYPQLRNGLQAELLGAVDAEDRIRTRLDRGALLATVIDDELTSLRELPRAVPQPLIDEAATRVLAARRVLIFARGNATVLAGLLVRRLRRFGTLVTDLTGPDRDVAEELVSLQPGDLVVVLAFRRPSRVLPALLETVRETGAGLLVLTDVLGQPDGAPDSTVVLAAPRGNGREYQSLTVPMALANALVLAVAQADQTRASTALTRLDTLLERFES